MTIRSDIQILRGVSVLLVIFYHLQIDWFRNGFLGVDVFFVISGYLMARLYGGRGWRDFYARRVRRLLPGASVALALTLVVASQILLPIEFQQTSEQVRFGLLFLTNIYYWNSDSYFDADEFRPLLHFWSLAVEMQVYLALPSGTESSYAPLPCC